MMSFQVFRSETAATASQYRFPGEDEPNSSVDPNTFWGVVTWYIGGAH